MPLLSATIAGSVGKGSKIYLAVRDCSNGIHPATALYYCSRRRRRRPSQSGSDSLDRPLLRSLSFARRSSLARGEVVKNKDPDGRCKIRILPFEIDARYQLLQSGLTLLHDHPQRLPEPFLKADAGLLATNDD